MCTETEGGNHSHNNPVRQNHYGRGFMRSVSGLEKQPNKSHQGSQESNALFLSVLKGWVLKYRTEGHHVVGVVCVYVASEANIHWINALN